MARNDRGTGNGAKRGLSVAETLAELELIDASLDSVCATAPVFAEAFGGRDAVQVCSQMTCIGLVPRYPEAAWEAVAAEHAESQRLQPMPSK